ncbi:hypothetical protein EPI10_000882 [Gossypium australe]|uniref:Uncharacterized protein n=1 Tax=Gossypium australe TaxID=47621 RepID=A0A5B6V9L9_9ROSI|nr:hypothetical protein EPI10_000882 [Gossypium australe]
MDLVQGTLSVDEYEAELVRLSPYAPELVVHEIKLYLVAQSAEVFDELVEKACALEETLGEEPKVVSAGAIKKTSESDSGSSQKGKRGCFETSGRRGAASQGQDRQAARA